MFIGLLLPLATSRMLDFEALPPAESVEAGRSVYRHGAGIDRTLMDAKNVLGTWYDGRIKRPVDIVVWVGPEMAARWLGYLAERDAWSDDDLSRRWRAMRVSLEGKVTFIVRLSAFPRLDPFEFGIDAPPHPETLRNVKVLLSFDTKAMHADSGYVWSAGKMSAAARAPWNFQFEKENAADVTGRPFYSLTRFAPLFMDAGQVDLPDDGIPLGDYYGAIYVAQFPMVESLRAAQSMDLTVNSISKRESARFQLRTIPEAPKINHDCSD
jgi:hypothetical protein